MTRELTYRVFEGPTGYFFCDDSLDYLDARGNCYVTPADATSAAINIGRQTAQHEDVMFLGVTGSGVCTDTAHELGCDVL